MNSDDASKGCKKYTRESSSYFLPQAAIGFFTSIAANLFGSHDSASLSGPSPSVCISEVGNESEISHEKGIVETCDLFTKPHSTAELERFGKKILIEEGKEIEGNSLPHLKANETADQFRQFDMVSDCSDHNFHGASKELVLSQVRNRMKFPYKCTTSYFIHSGWS